MRQSKDPEVAEIERWLPALNVALYAVPDKYIETVLTAPLNEMYRRGLISKERLWVAIHALTTAILAGEE